MDRQYFIDRFYFKNNCILDDEISSVGAIKADALIDHMQRNLLLKSQTSPRQFKVKAIVVSMFEKPRTSIAMNFDPIPMTRLATSSPSIVTPAPS